MRLKVGQRVQVTLWSGQVVSVTSGSHTGYTVGNPPPDKYTAVWISVILLAAALAVARFYRSPQVGRALTRVLRIADPAVFPAFLAAIATLAVYKSFVGLLVVMVMGTTAALCYLPAMPWRAQEQPHPAPKPARRRTPRLRGFGDGAPPWDRTVTAACPVGPERRAWIERNMHWFVRQFGKYTALGDAALPVPGFYPALYRGRPAQIHALFDKVCARMYVNPRRIRLILSDDPLPGGGRGPRKNRVVGRFLKWPLGRDRIWLDVTQAADPAFLTAVIAHELGHERLLGERRITSRRKDHERLTDLVTGYLGMGVFDANASLIYQKADKRWTAAPLGDLTEAMLNSTGTEHHLGYLSDREFGYALAWWARLRGENDPSWATHLDVGVRTYFKRSLAYLAERADGVD